MKLKQWKKKKEQEEYVFYKELLANPDIFVYDVDIATFCTSYEILQDGEEEHEKRVLRSQELNKDYWIRAINERKS